MLAPGELVHFKKGDDLKNILIKNKNQVLFVDFYAHWCPPCQVLGPKLAKYCKDNNYCLLSVDAEENEDLTEELSIENIPRVFLFINGKKVLDFNGVNDAFLEKCTEVINEKFKK